MSNQGGPGPLHHILKTKWRRGGKTVRNIFFGSGRCMASMTILSQRKLCGPYERGSMDPKPIMNIIINIYQ
jgi:hypothetical protein